MTTLIDRDTNEERGPVATIEMSRLALGKRATDEQWDLARCQRSAAARLDIAAGANGAGTWAVAIDGQADKDTIEFIAWQGVRGAEEARLRWARKATMLRAIVGEKAMTPPVPAPTLPVVTHASRAVPNGILVRTTRGRRWGTTPDVRLERVHVVGGSRR